MRATTKSIKLTVKNLFKDYSERQVIEQIMPAIYEELDKRWAVEGLNE